MTSAELPWSTRTLCTFLPPVTTEMTTGSLSCGTTSRRSPLVNTRSDSHGSPEILSSIELTPLAYFFRWEAVGPPPEKTQQWCEPRRERASRALAPLSAPARRRVLRRNPSETRFSPAHQVGNPTRGSCQCDDQRPRGTRTKSLSVALTPCQFSPVTSTSQLY